VNRSGLRLKLPHGNTDTASVKLRWMIAPVALSLAVAGCGGIDSVSSSSAYRPPPRQVPVLPDSLDMHGCSDATMGGNLLAVCDPGELQSAWENDTLTGKGTLKVTIANRKVHVASAPGLTQVEPADGIGTLLVPATVTISGKASDGSYLYISANSHTPEHVAWGEALFRNLGLAHGGSTVVALRLDHGAVAFHVRRPDGSTLAPLRRSHWEGPGPRASLPQLPRHYADTPEQGVRTYVAAINARDGKTICELLSPKLQSRSRDSQTPCWAAATGVIDYGPESDSPVFQRLELLGIDSRSTKKRGGSTFVGVAVRLRRRQLEERYSNKSEVRDSTAMVWFRRTSSAWRIAAEPFFGVSELGAPST
jgi:hypothetical protein